MQNQPTPGDSGNFYIPVHKSLWGRLSMAVLLGATVLLTLFGAFRFYMIYNVLAANLQAQLDRVTDRLQTGLAVPLYKLDHEAVQAAIRSEMQNPATTAIIIQESGSTVPPYGLSRKDGKLIRIKAISESKNTISASGKIQKDGELLGTVHVYFSTSVIMGQLWHSFFLELTSIVILDIVLLAVMFVIIRRLVVSPLSQMVKVSRQVADGRLNCPIEIADQSEIGILAGSIQRMRDAIVDMINGLEAKNTELANEVAEREAAQAALQDQRERLHITLDSIGDAVIATDTSGVVTLVNPVAETLTGWPRDEALGKPLDEVFNIISAETRAQEENPVSKVVRTGKIIGLANHTLLISRDGTELQIADSGAPIRNPEGETVGVVLVFRDVTEQYELEEQLRHSQKMDSIGHLAGGVAHDFNNMLGGIMGAAELIESRVDKDSPIRRFSGMILTASQRASELTEQLLAFSRKIPRQNITVDVHDCIDHAMIMLQRTIDKRIDLKVSCEAPQSSVVGDPAQIENAILNICLNARDAMPEGGEISVTTAVRHFDSTFCSRADFELTVGDYIEIAIADTGTGMNTTTLKKIFEPFFTTKEIGKGTGLGLAAVYGTAKDHFGMIVAESEQGKGTTFRLSLPLGVAAQKSPEPTEPDQQSTGACVLVVDDEELMRAVAREYLTSMAYDVMEAEDGMQALEVFEKRRDEIDLVLLDLMMPRMSGKETFEALKKLDPDLPILLATGFSKGTQTAELLANGAEGLLRKPYSGKDLSTAVAQALSKKQSLQE